MGRTANAGVYVGMLVTEKTFFEEVTRVKVVCAHAMDKGMKFCPTCGTPVGKRKQTTIETVYREPFAAELKALEEQPYDDEQLPVTWDFLQEEKVFGLEIICLTGPEIPPVFILGKAVASGTSYGPEVQIGSTDEFTKAIDRVKAVAEAHQLDLPVQMFFTCYLT